ncbi:hypothetical protein D7D52_21085 [Nocardia yunnanensis]|uniref:Acyl transferase n=2 Tax=Nocardia yunnanensis TaxID=2382165 RepID=A0A386ZH82_9NOCA|nr:hypothetical protein D7D52_21085 [Nocardia yunnanensis]
MVVRHQDCDRFPIAVGVSLSKGDPMRTTTSERSRRAAAVLLGLAAGVAALSGCSTTTTPGPVTGQPLTVVTPSATTVVLAPPTTRSGGGQSTTDEIPPPVTPTQAPPTSKPPVTQSNPPAGTTFTGEGLTAAQAAAEQQAVDAGHQPWRLDTVQVAKTFVAGRFGWTTVQTSTGAPMVVFVTNQDGSKVTLHLIQPATKGDAGIWEVDSGVWD